MAQLTIGTKKLMLTIVSARAITDKSGTKRFMYLCQCECGAIKDIRDCNFGKTYSCGCYILNLRRNKKIARLERTTACCTQCGINFPFTAEFFPKDVRSTLKGYCKVCSINFQRSYVSRNRDKVSKARKNFILKKTYGLNTIIYNQIFEDQKGCCAICKDYPIRKRLSVDHCHKSGKVRGLICSSCNFAIGMFKDSSIILKSATTYIDKHGV